jgi:hypothetical protein
VGALPIDAAKLQSETITQHSQFFAIGIHKTITLSEGANNTRIVNLVGDADGNTNSLKAIEQLIQDCSLKDVINKPSDVRKSSRTALPAYLNNIDKVRVARSEAREINDLAELIAFVRACRMSFPMIVRLSGYHNARYMKKIDTEKDLEQVNDWFEISKHFIVMEYIDSLQSSGYFRKARLSVINGRFFPQHFLSAEHWCVGVENRYDLMLKNPRLRDDEKKFFQSFERDIYPLYAKSLIEIHKRLNMDIYGIDCFFKDNGEIVVFEANPCMDLLSMWLGPNNEYDYKIPYRAAVRDAIIKLLSS